MNRVAPPGGAFPFLKNVITIGRGNLSKEKEKAFSRITKLLATRRGAEIFKKACEMNRPLLDTLLEYLGYTETARIRLKE